ncbi:MULTISPECIES: DUF2889 domain-containing protein [Pseudomonas]|nr:DUF2889 domain-containing protein [Pseudomonas marincola]SFT81484.1 Protein of unknown function [Pseudomonas marincola]
MTVFRRRVEIVASYAEQSGEVRATLEDDFHHFRVRVRHNAGVVSAVDGEAIRFPYSLCPQACEQLQHLLSMPMSQVAHSVTRQTDASHQCTHLLDLAGLAIAAAARGAVQLRYDINVGQRVNQRTRAVLLRDDRPYLSWQINGTQIEGPIPYAGINLREGMARWAISNLSVEAAEAALLLRRCTLISMGRAYNLDAQIHAITTGHCYTQQPERAEQALRMQGSTWDFTDEAHALCAEDQVWLRDHGDRP